MYTVKHNVKKRSYDYATEEEAREHADAAVQQSEGKLVATDTGEKEITLDVATAAPRSE